MHERRNACRIDVGASQSDGLIEINGKRYATVIDDRSAGGYGAFLPQTVKVELQQTITLKTGSAVFECKVTHLERVDGLQRLGMQNVHETSLQPLPKTGSWKNCLGHVLSKVNVLMLLGAIVGLAVYLNGESIIDLLNHHGDSPKSDATIVRGTTDAGTPTASADEKKGAGQQSSSKKTSKADSQASEMLDQILARKRQAAEFLTGNDAIDWQQFVKRVKLSADQESKILKLIEELSGSESIAGDAKLADEFRIRSVALMSSGQRSRFLRLLQTGPL